MNIRMTQQRHPMPMRMALTAAIALVLHGTSPAHAQNPSAAQVAAQSSAGAASANTPDGSVAASTAAAVPAAAVAQTGQEAEREASRDSAADLAADPKNVLDSIIVTGSFADSLGKAIDIKRDSSGQTDTILAEDIGKFPDLNLAESLQRIPGVTIARDAGEGRTISVRGLGPQFTRVRINGLEALTTTGGTDSSGGANRGRGFDFNIFASELFNRVTVNKTAAAEIEEGSLGATVDLYTARPFDYGKFTAVASAQGSYNDLSDNTDPRASAMISNVFLDGTLGAIFSVAYTKRNLEEEGHSTVRWDRGTASGGFNADSPFAEANSANVFHPRIPRYGVLTHEQERLGVTAALQWQAADNTLFTLDALYAEIDATRGEDFLEGLSFSRSGSSGKPETVVLDGAVSPNGNLVYGLFDNVDVRSESRYDELSTRFTQFSLALEHEFNDSLRLNGVAGHSNSDFSNPIQTTITVDHPNADGYMWDYRNNSNLPLISNGFNVNDPSSWQFASGSEIRLRPQYVDNSFDNFDINLAGDLTDNFTLTGGFTWKQYEFESRELRRASETLVPALPAGTNIASLLRPISLTDLGVPSGTDTSWLAPDIDAFNQLFDIYSNTGIFAVSPNVPSARGNNRGVLEKDTSVWLQGDFRGNIGDIPIRGNIGVRQVNTNQNATGYALVGNEQVLVSVERKYDDTLPSFNLVAEVTEDFLIRFGASKVMSRPDLGFLTPGVTVSVSGGNNTVTGGNPNIEPLRATTVDFSFEWYFAEDSLLSIAPFWKDIDSFVQTSRETRPYFTSGLPLSLLIGTGASPTDDFTFNIPINTPGGTLTGVEFSYQQPFSFLPSGWDDFGAIFNYTYVDSQIQYLTSTGADSLKTDLTGLSKNAYNATLYYENERFSARISAAYRDEFLTTVPGRNGNDVEGTKGTTNIDMSASWNINENFVLSFEGLNLTDEFNDQYVDSVGDRASVYHHTGRIFILGFTYRH